MPLTAKRLEEYRPTLLELRHRVLGNVEHVVEAINDDSNSLANLSSTPVHLADIAQPGVAADVEVLDSQNDLLRSIDKALARIGEGVYGTCDDCGRDIPSERLKALPFSTRCAACAQASEPESRPHPR